MDIDTMTAEALRLAIAKAQCWADVRYDVIRDDWVGEPPCDPDRVILNASVPNWPADIAAAWELEESIPENERGEYTKHLREIVMKERGNSPFWYWLAAHATPTQRCRAYLKWKEG